MQRYGKRSEFMQNAAKNNKVNGATYINNPPAQAWYKVQVGF